MIANVLPFPVCVFRRLLAAKLCDTHGCCTKSPDCKHILAFRSEVSRLGGLYVVADNDDLLAIALSRALPRLYADPKLEPKPALKNLSTDARIGIMRARVAAGEQLYHPDDFWRNQPQDEEILFGVEAIHVGNGTAQETDATAADRTRDYKNWHKKKSEKRIHRIVR